MTKQEIIGELLSINEKVKQKNRNDSSSSIYAIEKTSEAVSLIEQYQSEDLKEKDCVKKALEKMKLIKELANKSKINATADTTADLLTKVQEAIEEFVIETQGLII